MGGVDAGLGGVSRDAPPGQVSGASTARCGSICLVGIWSTGFLGGPIGRERAGRLVAERSRVQDRAGASKTIRETQDAPRGAERSNHGCCRGSACALRRSGQRRTSEPPRARELRAGNSACALSGSRSGRRKTSLSARVKRRRQRRRGGRGCCYYYSSWRSGWRAVAEILLVLDKAEKEVGTSTLLRARSLIAAAKPRPPPSGSGKSSGSRRQTSSSISAGPRSLKLLVQFSFATTTVEEGGHRLRVTLI